MENEVDFDISDERTIPEADDAPTGRLVHFDWAIKYILRNKAHFGVLEGFLFELLKQEVKIDCLLESESNRDHKDDKSNHVDLLVQLAGGERVIIEVQCASEWDYLSRILYGTSKLVTEYISKGENYGKISKVISVNLVYFTLGVGTDYLYRGRTRFVGMHTNDRLRLNSSDASLYPANYDDAGDIFPEYYLIRVNQFSKRVTDKLDEWIYFFKTGEIKKKFSC